MFVNRFILWRKVTSLKQRMIFLVTREFLWMKLIWCLLVAFQLWLIQIYVGCMNSGKVTAFFYPGGYFLIKGMEKAFGSSLAVLVRLGPGTRCPRCLGTLDSTDATSPGHFGIIKLPVYIYHPSHVTELTRYSTLFVSATPCSVTTRYMP